MSVEKPEKVGAYGEHPNSILSMLAKGLLDPALRAKFYKNKQACLEERRLAEWIHRNGDIMPTFYETDDPRFSYDEQNKEDEDA